MYYVGIDRWNYDYNSLAHFKYIKKIGNRYFYTPEELRAYYNADKKAADLDRKQANFRVDARVGLAQIHPGMDRENKAAYKTLGKVLKTHNNIKAKVQPVVRTAKLATGAKSKKGLVTKANKSLIKKRGMMTIGKVMRAADKLKVYDTTTYLDKNGKVIKRKNGKKRWGLTSHERTIQL